MYLSTKYKVLVYKVSVTFSKYINLFTRIMHAGKSIMLLFLPHQSRECREWNLATLAQVLYISAESFTVIVGPPGDFCGSFSLLRWEIETAASIVGKSRE